MALSETVKSSLRDAQEDLKNALACAARTEKPFISKNIADMIAQIENVIDACEVIDQIEERKDGDSGKVQTEPENTGLLDEDELIANGYQLTDTGWVKA